jgi:hypothetical protein
MRFMARSLMDGPGWAPARAGLLAGPILRRAEAAGIRVWIATSEPVSASLRVYRARGEGHRAVGAGEGVSVRLGQRLFVHLLTARPAGRCFPADELLTYDLELSRPGWSGTRRLAELGLLDGDDTVAYPGLALPSLFLQASGAPLRVLHGSCRKLHGKGQDALLSADELLQQTGADLARRPSALFLTGDQIYGDDVAGALIVYLHQLGVWLTGQAEQLPGIPPQALDGVGERQRWVQGQAGFTSPRAANHLLTFGEFAACYLLAFADTLWPGDLDELVGLAERTSPRMGARARRRLRARLQELDTARQALPSVRRVLANVPTYMSFDDHDVTDDWNLTSRWRERVAASSAGRRIVANALAAFWAFQGWGNDPSLYGEAFVGAVAGHLGGGGGHDAATAERFEQTLWSFDRWSFAAPTRPAAICLDTRTQRAYESNEGAARLIGPAGLDRIAMLIRTSDHDPGGPLLLVSATPVCGLELQERRQKFLAKRLGPYQVDFEEWHSNLHGLVDLMALLAATPSCQTVVVLSGDVHYAMTIDVRFNVGDTTVHLAQLVSSGLKHSGTLTKQLLRLLGTLNRRHHRRIGWAAPPEIPDDGMPMGTLKRRLLLRPVNTDAWVQGGPVFLAPSTAYRLGISQPPDYVEARTYLRPDGPWSSPLIGENNLGVVDLDGHQITHRILSRSSHTTTHRARLDLGRAK